MLGGFPESSRISLREIMPGGWTRICASHANGYDQHRNTRIRVSARLAVRFCGLRFPAASCSAISRSRVFKGRRGVCLRARSLTEGFFSPLSAQIYLRILFLVRFQSKIPRKSQFANAWAAKCSAKCAASRTHRADMDKSIFTSMSRFSRDGAF